MEATISRSIINDHYEVIDTRHGLMLLNRHDIGATAAIESEGAWAWGEIESLKDYYKGIMLDVGANVGAQTLTYARFASHVYAFEPQVHVYHNLCANLLLNNITNVTALKCALGSVNGNMLMRSFDPNGTNCPAGAALGRGDYTVPVRTLDGLAIPHVDFIKIDVEGHELEVLKGAVQTLKRSWPVVYVEIHAEKLIEQVVGFMEELGYQGTDWCHTDILSARDYPDRIQFTEGYVFTCAH